ncbi:succinate dehydrogenase [Roseovarius sp.]|uniref:succinate dehydrogenase n=1 Tax=Roseovarius sp. TaxID=1486281 RepID=UPI0025DE92AF|nr:succinate dehydrogenase [Roseovarius sp.]
MRLALASVALVAVTACDVANEAADTVARDRAKGVVSGVVENRFPGVNAAPVTDCIIDAASAREIISIAGASVTGVTQSTVEQVVEIASRPDAVTCIAQNSLTSLAG